MVSSSVIAARIEISFFIKIFLLNIVMILYRILCIRAGTALMIADCCPVRMH